MAETHQQKIRISDLAKKYAKKQHNTQQIRSRPRIIPSIHQQKQIRSNNSEKLAQMKKTTPTTFAKKISTKN